MMELQGIYREASQLHQQGNLEAAKERYLQLLDKDFEVRDVAYRMAVIAYQERDFKTAAQYIQQSLSVGPCELSLWCCAGKIYTAQYDYATAAGYYEQCLDKDAQHLEALFDLGVLARRQNHLEKAERLLRRLLEIKQTTLGYAELAWVFRAAKKKDMAINTFQAVLKQDEDCLPALRGMGAMLQDEGDLSGAEHYLRKANSNHPKLPETHADLGFLFLKMDRHQWAGGAFQTALSIDANYREALFGLSQAMHLLGSSQASIQWMERAQKIFPDEESTYRFLRLLYQFGQLQRALQVLENYLKDHPVSTRMRALSGMIHYGLKASKEGRSQINRAAIEMIQSNMAHLSS